MHRSKVSASKCALCCRAHPSVSAPYSDAPATHPRPQVWLTGQFGTFYRFDLHRARLCQYFEVWTACAPADFPRGLCIVQLLQQCRHRMTSFAVRYTPSRACGFALRSGMPADPYALKQGTLCPNWANPNPNSSYSPCASQVHGCKCSVVRFNGASRRFCAHPAGATADAFRDSMSQHASVQHPSCHIPNSV